MDSGGTARNSALFRPVKRDLRLDFLRGIGQWMVLLDHIPYNFLNWFTLRNYGFSDAAEFFVFISGYSIGFAYGPPARNGEFLAAVASPGWRLGTGAFRPSSRYPKITRAIDQSSNQEQPAASL